MTLLVNDAVGDSGEKGFLFFLFGLNYLMYLGGVTKSCKIETVGT